MDEDIWGYLELITPWITQVELYDLIPEFVLDKEFYLKNYSWILDVTSAERTQPWTLYDQLASNTLRSLYS